MCHVVFFFQARGGNRRYIPFWWARRCKKETGPPADINRVNQALGLTGRIDREQWIEQAQILAMGGETYYSCLLYTSDAADERSSVDLGGRRIIKKKTTTKSARPCEYNDCSAAHTLHLTDSTSYLAYVNT